MQIEELKQAVIEEQHKNETCKFLESSSFRKLHFWLLMKFLDRLGVMLNKSISESANSSGSNSPSSTSSGKKVDFSNILSLTT